MIHLILAFVLAQAVPIGSGLSDGMEIVYESAGVAQTPWVYDSVRVVERDDFERCVLVARRSQGVRESCVRRDTLFEIQASGLPAATRPVGSNMELTVHAPSGNVLRYTTGVAGSRRVAGDLEVSVMPTTIVTRDAQGTVIRRLREEYAPSLLTAVRGVFEEPGPEGGWTTVREFSLRAVTAAPAPSPP